MQSSLLARTQSRSDSFYFVEGQLIMHTKAVSSSRRPLGCSCAADLLALGLQEYAYVQ